jgi:hypothetical protein
VAQLFALAIEDLDGYKKRDYTKFYEEYRKTLDEEESTLKVLKLKEKDLEPLLFTSAQYLKKHKTGPMDAFLKR